MAVSPLMSSGNAVAKTRDTSGSASGSTNSTASTGSSSDDLLNNFMTLLVAQMQNQDPTSPMDNNQLTAQLAQFNTAAGVEQLNTTMNSLGTMVASMQQMNAAQWVGREVMIEGDPMVSTAANGNQQFGFSLNSSADDVTVALTDTAGNTYSAKLKNVQAGVHQYSLDDLADFQPSDPRGQVDTSFKVSLSAANADGNTPSITALKQAKVESVSFTSSGAVLQLGINGTATLGDVYLIE